MPAEEPVDWTRNLWNRHMLRRRWLARLGLGRRHRRDGGERQLTVSTVSVADDVGDALDIDAKGHTVGHDQTTARGKREVGYRRKSSRRSAGHKENPPASAA